MNSEQRETSEKYKNITNNIHYSNLFNKPNEVLEQYKEYILDNHKKEEYKNIIEVLRKDSYIDAKYQIEQKTLMILRPLIANIINWNYQENLKMITI